MGFPVKTKVENGLRKLFDLWGQTIDVYDQAVFILKDSGIHDEEGKKTNVSNTITASKRRSGSFFLSSLRPTQIRLIQTAITVS